VILEEWQATGTHEGDLMGLPATHRKGATLGCNVIQVGRDGLIHSETTYWDAAGLTVSSVRCPSSRVLPPRESKGEGA
jgi:hypothetical protein